MNPAFFILHRDLPREGPGLPEDVAWAAGAANLRPDARILDAGCGPGADIPALQMAAPAGHVTGVDGMAHFVAAAAEANPQAVITQGEMLDVSGPFDFIWCAGAIYFAGITRSLQAWDQALAEGGHVAFSTPCHFTPEPSPAALAFWEGEGDIPTLDDVVSQVAAADFRLIAQRPVSDAAWEAYYRPMERRIAKLRPGADAALSEVLDQGLAEAAAWRAARAETGYQLCVVTR